MKARALVRWPVQELVVAVVECPRGVTVTLMAWLSHRFMNRNRFPKGTPGWLPAPPRKMLIIESARTASLGCTHYVDESTTSLSIELMKA